MTRYQDDELEASARQMGILRRLICSTRLMWRQCGEDSGHYLLRVQTEDEWRTVADFKDEIMALAALWGISDIHVDLTPSPPSRRTWWKTALA